MQVDYWKISNVFANCFRVTWPNAITNQTSDKSHNCPLNLDFVVGLLLYDSLHCFLGKKLELLIKRDLEWLLDWNRLRDWLLPHDWLGLLDLYRQPHWIKLLDRQRPRWLKTMVIKRI